MTKRKDPTDLQKKGRKSLYQSEYCNQLIQHMEQGLSFESFAGKLRVSRECLYEWCKVHPEFSDAKRIGNDLRLQYFEQVGMDLMLGKVKGNSAVWIYSMKAFFKYFDSPAAIVAAQPKAEEAVDADPFIEQCKKISKMSVEEIEQELAQLEMEKDRLMRGEFSFNEAINS